MRENCNFWYWSSRSWEKQFQIPVKNFAAEINFEEIGNSTQGHDCHVHPKNELLLSDENVNIDAAVYDLVVSRSVAMAAENVFLVLQMTHSAKCFEISQTWQAVPRKDWNEINKWCSSDVILQNT